MLVEIETNLKGKMFDSLSFQENNLYTLSVIDNSKVYFDVDTNCCGITFSKALNFTLRNGGIVNKYDGIDRNSEPVILFDKKVWVPEVWGVKSWSKDCFKGNRPGKNYYDS